MPTKFRPIEKSKIRIKRNDMVIVVAGKDKGDKPHRVLRVIADRQACAGGGRRHDEEACEGQPAEEYQGRDRRAGITDSHLET